VLANSPEGGLLVLCEMFPLKWAAPLMMIFETFAVPGD
jgi:hypothetical protein